MDDTDHELTRDIGYALSQSPFKTKGQRIEALRLVAVGIVEHLRRAGWIFALRQPDPLHGPSTPLEPSRAAAGAHIQRGASDETAGDRQT